MKYISYIIFKAFVQIFKYLPFQVIYRFSDLIAWLLNKVLRYRYKVINENLNLIKTGTFSFNNEEILKGFYKNLADITMESIKGLSMTADAIQQRHKWINPELLDEAFAQNKSVILVSGHYNNWEWAAFSPTYFLKHKIIGLYKPLTNQIMNNYILKKRATSGTILADINLTNDFFEEYWDKKSVFLMASDQSPTKPELAIWSDFLGVDTAFLHGLEKYVEKYNLPVVFCDIQRVKRGFYTLEMSWIKDLKQEKTEYGVVTEMFIRKLENVVKKEPRSWLWSHRRWKHKKSNQL